MNDQGTAGWLADRAGHLTASCFADIMAKTKSGYAASRGNLLARLVAERMTGVPETSFTSTAMQWGTEQEPIARAEYEMLSDDLVQETGFVKHPSIEWSGASPDGMIGSDGLIEIKCPNTQTHIDYILTRTVPKKYLLQMQWQMECTERAWCDFCSFDPRMPKSHAMFVIRVHRDEVLLVEMRQAATAFLEEVESTIHKLREMSSDQLLRVAA